MKSKKKIIRCPFCWKKGIKQNLAELLPSGYIAVLRSFSWKLQKEGKAGQNSTLIGGTDFFIVCGRCNKKVYIKQYKL